MIQWDNLRLAVVIIWIDWMVGATTLLTINRV